MLGMKSYVYPERRRRSINRTYFSFLKIPWSALSKRVSTNIPITTYKVTDGSVKLNTEDRSSEGTEILIFLNRFITVSVSFPV